MNFHPTENSIDTSNICVPILISMFNPKSVLDLGCNVGCWLKSFEMNGVSDVIGVDGDNMIDSLLISSDKFIVSDLTKPIELKRTFDLCICLEVAEHIEERYCDELIKNAILHSDLIFWSAADIGQGGYNHVNEQHGEYWINKFKERGYRCINMSEALPKLPHDYYRKNALIFIYENNTN